MFISVAVGGVISLGAVFLLGVFIVRKRLTPVQERKLPPSGARPWKLSRDASLHGNTGLYGRNADR